MAYSQRSFVRRLAGSTAVALAIQSGSASAQEAGQASSAAPLAAQDARGPVGADSGDIIVTARRREEKLSDVPVSVAAFSPTVLQERGIKTESDLQFATAGLTVRQTGSSNQTNYSLRGQSIDAFSFASPAVLVYFNEFNAQGATASAFFDLDSIQVLKGPQGTLFGRNATGGAVLYQSKRPDVNEMGGYATGGYGNYNDIRVEGAINIPIVKDMAGFRLAAQYEKRDGFQRNRLLNIRNGSLDNLTIRPSLTLKPAEGLTSVTVFQYGRYGGRSTSLKADSIYTPGQTNNGITLSPAIPTASVYVPGVILNNPAVSAMFSDLNDYIRKTAGSDFYDVYTNTTAQHRARQYLATNTSTYEITSDVNVKNVFGYNRTKSFDATDVDGSPFSPLVVGYFGSRASLGYRYTDTQISDELQINGTSGDKKLTYIAGLYFFHGMNRQNQPLGVLSDVDAAAQFFLRKFQFDNYSKAVFGQVSYRIAPKLNVTAGARYTWELSKYKPLGADINGTVFGVPADSRKYSKPSWNVSLDYKVTPELLVYAAQRGSWRTGGFNGTAFTTVNGVNLANVYNPETTYDFEVGAKYQGDLGGLPARFNIALYDQYIKNVVRAVYIQVSAVSGNVKKARVRGVELDGDLKPADWLQVGGNFAYTDAQYTNPAASVGDGSFSFGPYADAPKYSGSVFGRLRHELPNQEGELALRGDVYGQTHFFYSNLNASIIPGTRLPGYVLANARLEYNDIRGTGLSVAGFVKNLTDKKYSVGGFALGAVLGINSSLPGVPRTYGVEATFKF